MYSLIAVVALFVAIILNDVLQQNSSEIPKHALFGLISTLGMFVLWYNDHELVGWGLLIVPIFILFISFIIVLLNKKPSSSTSSTASTGSSKFITNGINKNDMGWNGHSRRSKYHSSWENEENTTSKNSNWLDRMNWDKSGDTSSSNTTKLSIPESSITPSISC
jgi:hypothetical protein